MARRRIDPTDGEAAVSRWRAADADRADRAVLTLAVRYALQTLGDRAPGHSVEVRVPPAGVVQVVEGLRHTRGTPPNVVETDPRTFLALATGDLTWEEARATGAVSASGSRADLGELLPLWPHAG
ncbi:sterol carrier family protein [Ruania suaedae]|uniref:sterol carrier family protein n=1 Tax=Ruania suaedae TaxID=2897774 RepID=UPI001E4AB913|nr:sterol carrier family protein [Ruania suaedae]UFU02635.1 sterol carrier family protein [Ruania suaedae]